MLSSALPLPGFPVFHGLLPVGFGRDGFFGRGGLRIALLVAPALFFHGGDGGFVQNLDGSALDGCLEFFFAKGLAGGVEVGDVELKIHAQAVADEFLLIAVAGLLAAKQADDGVYFAL